LARNNSSVQDFHGEKYTELTVPHFTNISHSPANKQGDNAATIRYGFAKCQLDEDWTQALNGFKQNLETHSQVQIVQETIENYQLTDKAALRTKRWIATQSFCWYRAVNIKSSFELLVEVFDSNRTCLV
jgi:hypothetical protein